jgi:hypothetical protein
MPQVLQPSEAGTNSEGLTVSLEQVIQEAIAQARSTCHQNGDTSPSWAVAWDIVEELQAERSHRQMATTKNAFERYCDENPDADECRIYDV